MDLRESLRMAWRSIQAHRLRSTLTTIGVVIGVGAVITFVALGASLQTAVLGDIAAGESPTMSVTTQRTGANGGIGSGSGQAVFTEHDIQQLTQLSDVARVIPVGQVQLSGITAHNQSLPLPTLTATTSPYFEHTPQASITNGSTFTEGSTHVVLNDVAATIFDQNVSVGDEITITPTGRSPITATVVGITTTPGDGGFGGQGGQPIVYGPVDVFYENRLTSPATGTEQRAYPRLIVVADDFQSVDPVADQVETYLRSEADAAALLPDTYEVTVLTTQEFIDRIREVLDTFTGFITGIAVISLIVGAIGIANIMLVSVTERTREIGIMKAVGFQNRDVLQLFLIEAIILGVIGSIVGIGVGIAAGVGVTWYLDLPFTFPVEYVGIAVLVGMVVGAVAGLYPAWNGARVDPIDALRYE